MSADHIPMPAKPQILRAHFARRPIYLITTGDLLSNTKHEFEKIRDALCSPYPIGAIQIREKDIPPGDLPKLYNLAREIIEIAHANSVLVFINADVEMCLDCGADGVHLGAKTLRPEHVVTAFPQLFVGYSAHSLDDIRNLESVVDYFLLGPIFSPLSKKDERPSLGLDYLQESCLLSKTGLIALGGIDSTNALDCLRHGAMGVAGIGQFLGARDPMEALGKIAYPFTSNAKEH